MSDFETSQEALFHHVIQRLFNSWTGLLIRIRNGNSEIQEKAEWLPSAISDWILKQASKNTDKKIYKEEISDTLEDILDVEFDLRCEDGSVEEISGELAKFYGLIFVENKIEEVNLLLTNLPDLNNLRVGNVVACDFFGFLNRISSENVKHIF